MIAAVRRTAGARGLTPGTLGNSPAAVDSGDRGEPESWAAAQAIDAAGCIVMPGIVNLHTHSDRSILRNPGTTSSLLQGVTTECTGMRGGSAFPRAARASDGGAGSDGSDWTDLAGFRERVNSNGTGINLVPLVGHGTVRTCVMGAEGGGGERHFPTPDEMKAMEVLVREAMEQGAFGISRGLIYAPGRNAVPAEVEALCSVVASYGGVHCSHLRSEEDMLIEDLDEMLENVRYAGIPSSVSHHKAMMRRNWGKPTETTRKIARAREEGLEVICDFYPWVISATSSLAGRFGRALGALDPSLSGIASQRKNLLAVLEDERTWALIRQALRDLFREEKAVNDARAAELAPTGAVVRNARDLRFWECIAHSPFHPEFFTLTFEDVAKRLGYDDYRDGMRRLYLEDEGQTTTGVGPTCEEDILTILRSPYSVVSSDSSTSDGRAGGHPRSYANFGYALVRFVKELKAISLEALVKKMTSQPATFVELTDRGVVRPGNWADIVVTDWENFRSTADFAHPHESPVGIRYVLVNGQLAVSEGAVTGVRAGRVIGRG